MPGAREVRYSIGSMKLPAIGHCALALITLSWACAPAPSAESQRAPASSLAPCDATRGAVYNGAECGTIRVFEDRHARKGRMIDIAFARWRSTSQPAAGAVFMLAGGPGGNGASMAGLVDAWFQPLRATLDFVVIDQRGTGNSNSLFCARDADARPEATFGHVFNPAWVKECRTALEAKADLRMYTTDLAAEDMDDVRAALGYEQIRVYGGSYGTRLAQAYMRQFPARTKAVVLDGAMPVDTRIPLTYATTAQQALDRVIDQCAAAPECRKLHPTLRADFARILGRFQAGPVTTTVNSPGRPPVSVTMSVGDFGYAIRGILYSAAMIRDLPDWIGRAARTDDVSEFAQRYWERQLQFSRSFSTGLHLSILCSEDAAFIGDADITPAVTGTFLGRYVIDEYRNACALWPVTTVPADLRRPVTSAIPTLLVSGFFDPVTPPSFADQIARTLSVSQHLVSPRGAHGSAGQCPLSAARFVLGSGTLSGMPDGCRFGRTS
jgi:pimeloyl-ACP methyl ester carboxylesterase